MPAPPGEIWVELVEFWPCGSCGLEYAEGWDSRGSNCPGIWDIQGFGIPKGFKLTRDLEYSGVWDARGPVAQGFGYPGLWDGCPEYCGIQGFGMPGIQLPRDLRYPGIWDASGSSCQWILGIQDFRMAGSQVAQGFGVPRGLGCQESSCQKICVLRTSG